MKSARKKRFFFYVLDPDLLTKVIKAVDEKLFNDFVLYKHLKVLVEEWKK